MLLPLTFYNRTKDKYVKSYKTHLKVRLIVTYITLFIIIFSITTTVLFYSVQSVIKKNIKLELENSSYLLNSMIKTAINSSIKNSLRTTSESGFQIAQHYFSLFENGSISENEAKARAIEYINTLKIGFSGYMYILDSNGVLLHHPYKELENTNISENDFIQDQILYKNGYIEYMWSNPGDLEDRLKALYMTYFEPWDWILSASSYNDEFLGLININDFEKQILGVKFGNDGYPVVFDSAGTFLIHPSLKGHNLLKEGDPQGDVVREMIQNKNGIIEYNWQNPEDKTFRKKITIYSEIEEYHWIVAASAYKKDFYQPLYDLTIIIVITIIFSLILVLFVTIIISNTVIKPIKSLEEKVLQGVKGDLSVRVKVSGIDEISQLGNHFNTFIESLEVQNKNLNYEISKSEDLSKKLLTLNEHLEEIIYAKTKELETVQDNLIHREKLIAINNIIKDIAHNINTPLGVALTSATYLEEKINDLQNFYDKNCLTKQILKDFFNNMNMSYNLMYSGIQKSVSLVNMFKLLTLDSYSLEKKMLNVKHEIEYSVHSIKYSTNNISNFKHEVEIDCPEDIEIYSYDSLLHVIIMNIIDNSLIHGFNSKEIGCIKIKVNKKEDYLSLSVSDNGLGINKDILPHVFDPFFTYKIGINHNIGLGLSIVYNLVTHIFNGKINIVSEENSGTVASIEIPVS